MMKRMLFLSLVLVVFTAKAETSGSHGPETTLPGNPGGSQPVDRTARLLQLINSTCSVQRPVAGSTAPLTSGGYNAYSR